MMKIAVIAGGIWDLEWGRKELAKNIDFVVGVDGGANHAVAAGRIPDILIGDLDSVKPDVLALCKEHGAQVLKYPREKDQTDLELALTYVQRYLEDLGKPEGEILLFAATGKRLDHLLGNIAVVLGFTEKQKRILLVEKTYRAWVMLPGEEFINGEEGQLLSILPLTEEAVVYSRGLYYELNGERLIHSAARGISNVFKENRVELKVAKGKILVVLNQN
ncbi:MAG: thiamine diphosphokinase [Desulfitobacteriia bacterium]|jgi:thiamine pyrophosphokinase